MENRNRRKVYEGKVLSNKMQKTVVVEIERKIHHPLYGKRITQRKKIYAHDAEGNVKEGDKVTVMECRPLSKLKRFRVVGISK